MFRFGGRGVNVKVQVMIMKLINIYGQSLIPLHENDEDFLAQLFNSAAVRSFS
jgi:hypothetical protein